MHYRPLGATGLSISEIGFGAWGIGGGWGALDDAEALKALHRFADLGGNFIDTAHGYGNGHSESLIGKFLKERTETIHVATKVPPKNYTWPSSEEIPATETFSKEWVIQCAEESLSRLGVDAIDLLQLHAWSERYLHEACWLEAMETLKSQGKVRFFGVSLNDRVPNTGLELVKSGKIHSIQLIFNLFHQEPIETLLPLCQERGVGVLVRVPFEEGALTGAFRPGMNFDEGDWRKDYFTPEWLERISERLGGMEVFLDAETPNLASLALKFCLAPPSVSSVLPGMRKSSRVEENVAISAQASLSSETLAALKAHAWSHGVEYPWVKAG
jgi:aryl-alcohol dehydrogenase-like predicted oxidoreductase